MKIKENEEGKYLFYESACEKKGDISLKLSTNGFNFKLEIVYISTANKVVSHN